MTFNPKQHPRQPDGRFRDKPGMDMRPIQHDGTPAVLPLSHLGEVEKTLGEAGFESNANLPGVWVADDGMDDTTMQKTVGRLRQDYPDDTFTVDTDWRKRPRVTIDLSRYGLCPPQHGMTDVQEDNMLTLEGAGDDGYFDAWVSDAPAAGNYDWDVECFDMDRAIRTRYAKFNMRCIPDGEEPGYWNTHRIGIEDLERSYMTFDSGDTRDEMDDALRVPGYQYAHEECDSIGDNRRALEDDLEDAGLHWREYDTDAAVDAALREMNEHAARDGMHGYGEDDYWDMHPAWYCEYNPVNDPEWVKAHADEWRKHPRES